MRVLILETVNQGHIQLDLNTGFCIYRGQAGIAAGHLKPASREQVSRFETHSAMCLLDLEFVEARCQERSPETGEMHAYTERNSVWTTSQIRRSYVAEDLTDF